MLNLWKSIKTEFIKLKRTPILYIHLLIPILGSILFLSYFSVSNWDTATKLITYFRSLAIVFPLLIGIITGIIIEQEEQAGSFQNMFVLFKKKAIFYCSKLLILLILSIASILMATFIFAFVFKNFDMIFYMKLGLTLFAGNIFVYVMHLFVSLKYGKEASIGLGIAGVLLSALMRTGLGDNIWYFIPWAWALRFCDYLMSMELNQLNLNDVTLISSINNGAIVLILTTLVSLILSISWFNKWEGRKSYD